MRKPTLTISLCLAAGIALTPALSQAANPGTSVRDTMENLRATALKASEHASELASLNHTGNSDWASNVYHWNSARILVNQMGREFAELEGLRASGSPAEREAIDKAAPQLKEIAETATAAIQFLNNNQENLWRPTYQNEVAHFEEECAHLSSTIGQYLRLEDLQAREKHLERSMGTAAGE